MAVLILRALAISRLPEYPHFEGLRAGTFGENQRGVVAQLCADIRANRRYVMFGFNPHFSQEGIAKRRVGL